MFKTIIAGPTPEQRYMRRMGFGGARVINGAVPNGRLPYAIGSGIFGCEGQDDGVFSGPTYPRNRQTGIFFDDTSRDNYEVQQPDIDWSFLRRPGVPLYPGSSSYGTVLIGPSMGTEPESTSTLNFFGIRPSWTLALILAGVAGVGIYVLNQIKGEEMGGF
jgi:hypothetical protein